MYTMDFLSEINNLILSYLIIIFIISKIFNVVHNNSFIANNNNSKQKYCIFCNVLSCIKK